MRIGLLIGIVFVALVVFTPAVIAADPPGGKHAEDENKLNLFEGALDLTIWTIVVFLVLFAVLRAFAWKPIAEGLDRREHGIARDKEEAERARREAEELRRSLAAERARVEDEIRQKIAKAEQDARRTADEEMARGKAELQAERERLHRELGVATDQALHQIWNQAAQLATIISAKAIGKELSYDDHRALLDESLKEFRQAAQARREDLESASA
jgi:F-type H+-transporting ATPase subunit b